METTAPSPNGPGAVRRPIELAQIVAAQADAERREEDAERARAFRNDLIRAAINHGDQTRRAIAVALNISDQHVGRLERGQTSGAAPVPRTE